MKLTAKNYKPPKPSKKPTISKQELVATAKSFLEAQGKVYLHDLVNHMTACFPYVFTRRQWAEKIKNWYFKDYNPPPEPKDPEVTTK